MLEGGCVCGRLFEVIIPSGLIPLCTKATLTYGGNLGDATLGVDRCVSGHVPCGGSQVRFNERVIREANHKYHDR